MDELIFLVEESDEGGYIAKALSAPIVTEAETIEELRAMVRDAVECHYDSANLRGFSMRSQIPTA